MPASVRILALLCLLAALCAGTPILSASYGAPAGFVLLQDDWSWLWEASDTATCDCTGEFISFLPAPGFYFLLFLSATFMRLLPGGQLHDSFQQYLGWYFYGPIDY